MGLCKLHNKKTCTNYSLRRKRLRMDKTKVCGECVKRKKLEMFEKRKDTGRYRRSCRECCSVKAQDAVDWMNKEQGEQLEDAA